jgi:hypothetical protein
MYEALVTREAIQKSFDRLKINEQNFGRLLTAISERPIEGAPVSVIKLKTKGKISYRITCNKPTAPIRNPTAATNSTTKSIGNAARPAPFWSYSVSAAK